VLALFLAFSEMLGKGAQTAVITHHVASNDLWAFYQAKHIRCTVLRTATEQLHVKADRHRRGHESTNQQDHRHLEEDRGALR
jgi:hypothetical protein